MGAFSRQLVAAAAAFAVVQAHPRGLQFSSLNPAWAIKRALYNLDDIADQGHKDKLTQGLKDAVTIAATLLDNMDSDKHKDKLAFWFGDQRSDDNSREIIRQVFKNFVDTNPDGTGADVNGQIIVSNTDYWKPTSDQTGGVGDGNTPFCSLEKDGKVSQAESPKSFWFLTPLNRPGRLTTSEILTTETAPACTSVTKSGIDPTWLA
jgi:hypothetical protein